MRSPAWMQEEPAESLYELPIEFWHPQLPLTMIQRHYHLVVA
jgi:hypothetical protein